MHRLLPAMVVLLSLSPAWAQLPLDPLAKPAAAPNALTDPAYKAGAAMLFDLESQFARDTEQGGGAAFAQWFASDAVILSNGKAPVLGQPAIAASANWPAAQYHLSWTPEGGRLEPGGNVGFTWGHYEGRSKQVDGTPIVTTGRYMTIWKKQPDGKWKVALEASNNEPPEKEDCCKLP
jgi:ketosteroid isomerase-like protein